ncbi:MAG: flippase [Actinomycetota bacterium]
MIEDVPSPQPDEARATAHRIVVNTFYRTVGDLGAKVASVALYVVMARKLGEAGFGIFTFAISFATLVTTLGNFGQDRLLTREVARDRGQVHPYFANLFGLAFALSVPVLAIAVWILTLTGTGSTTRSVVILLGLAVIAELLANMCFAVFQSYERLGFIAVILIAQRLITAGIGVVALLRGATVTVVAAIYLGGAALSLVLSLVLMFGRIVRPRFEIQVRTWPRLMRAAIPIGIASVFSAIFFRIDTVMLAAFKSQAAVGLYGGAYRLLEATLFLSWSVGAAVYPVFARLDRTTEPSIETVYERSVKLVVALTLPIAVGAGVVASHVLTLFYGAEFARGHNALALLAPTIALYPVVYVSTHLLVSQNRERVLTYVFAFVMVENVVANLILIPAFSLNGAAASTSISELIVTVLFVYHALRSTGPIDWLRTLLGPVVASACAGVTLYGLRHDIWIGVALGGVVYAGVLVAIERIFYADELGAFMRSLVRVGRT